MSTEQFYSIAADAMLVTHVLFVIFVVLGLILVFVGKFGSWRWVRNPWFRMAHLFGISIVVIQSWSGIICPLTTWEMELREKAGQAAYEGSFITHWLNELLYYQAPPWVFMFCYTFFGGLVLSSWVLVRPRTFSAGNRARAS
jgi:Protein of Unknown function (DUF2784)